MKALSKFCRCFGGGIVCEIFLSFLGVLVSTWQPKKRVVPPSWIMTHMPGNTLPRQIAQDLVRLVFHMNSVLGG